MTAHDPPIPAPGGRRLDAASATTRQIRGSAMLSVGRVVSTAANFAAQVLIVRALAKADFGAYAYALTIVLLVETVAVLGLDRAVSRFLPIYDERGERGKFAGTLVLVVSSILSVGLAAVVIVHGLQAVAGNSFLGDERQAASLVAILIVLAPIQALDSISISIFAVFSKPRAIFFRKHVLAPALRLLVVLGLVWSGSGVRFLAYGMVIAGVAGVVIYLPLLVRLLQHQDVLSHLRPQRLQIPARELLGFALPLLSVDALFIAMHTSDAILLAHFGSAQDIADFRAIQPAARWNQMMMANFALLFTPVAARLFARNDSEGVRDLYWRTAAWVAVFSFPIFLLTFSLAEPVTVGLYGESYRGSALFLALLAFGYYFNAALGFNGLTLRVFGLVKYVVAISLLAAVFNVAANLLLIPRYGALGAAIGTMATLVVHNLLKQAGLLRTGINVFDWRYLRVYVIVVGAAAVVFAVQVALDLGLAASVGLAAIASIAVIRLNRGGLDAEHTFPEIARIPLVGRLLRG
jgi:O-antigen/teichoic acid export membrane protein